MMERPTCKTCPYFKLPGDNHNSGWCYRYPPTLATVQDAPGEGLSEVRPVVGFEDFCGEHADFPLYLMWRRDGDLDDSDDEPDEGTSEAIEDLEARVSVLEQWRDDERTLQREQSERS